MRKFSFTSSQAHLAFKKAFPAFKNNESFVAVAQYIYGNDWIMKLLSREQRLQLELQGTGEEGISVSGSISCSSEEGNEQEEYNLLNPKPLYLYVNEIALDGGAHDSEVYHALGIF